MDISETWKNLGRERLESPIEGNFRNDHDSRHPMMKLKKNYLIKTVMMAAFVACFTTLFFLFDQLPIKWTLGILVVAYSIFFFTSYSMHRSINTDLLMDGPVIEVLTETKTQIARALKFETFSSLAISPVAGAAGYLMGYSVSGADISNIPNRPAQVVILVVTIVVFTVLGYFLGRRLQREGYGNSLKEMEVMIIDLRA